MHDRTEMGSEELGGPDDLEDNELDDDSDEDDDDDGDDDVSDGEDESLR